MFADTIRLKDGSIIKGKIVTYTHGTFVISIGDGSRKRELKFTAAEVDSIQFDSADETAARVVTSSRPNQPVTYRERIPDKTTVNKDVAKTEPRATPRTTQSIDPIEWRIKVQADNSSNGWTNSGWVVKKGQRIRVSADDGTISLGKGHKSTASGLGTIEDPQKLLKNVPTGALIAVIGDDNNDFIYIGAEREFTANRDGALFLGINEGNLNDNSGFFNVKIEILPERS